MEVAGKAFEAAVIRGHVEQVLGERHGLELFELFEARVFRRADHDHGRLAVLRDHLWPPLGRGDDGAETVLGVLYRPGRSRHVHLKNVQNIYNMPLTVDTVNWSAVEPANVVTMSLQIRRGARSLPEMGHTRFPPAEVR